MLSKKAKDMVLIREVIRVARTCMARLTLSAADQKDCKYSGYYVVDRIWVSVSARARALRKREWVGPKRTRLQFDQMVAAKILAQRMSLKYPHFSILYARRAWYY